MAQNQANFGLNFRVDKSGLNDLKKSLQDIMRLGQKNSATGTMTKELEEACKAAKQLETILDGAWNSKLGQLNLDKVNQGIKTTYHSVEELQTALGKTPQGQAAFNKMASQVLNTNLQLKQTNKLLDDMATSMANTVKWGIASSVFNGITRSVQDAFYYVKGLNSSLTDIRIVTGASADQMASFAEKANAAAKALGQTTRNYTDASLIYYQQGLSEADVEARTQTTLKAANVTGQSTEEVSELLTSVWNGYKVSAAEAEIYIDKIAAVATTTAADLEELSIGMSKVASAASLMGVDIDQLNAQLATIVSVTRQAPESVGTALKTIYARMGDIEAGLDGETTLGNYTEQMKEMGFNVLDAQGKLRDMGGVIEEIGGKWSSMTREQQLSLAQTVAGTRQYNNLLALFDNWDMYTNALNTSSQAMGTLQEQQDIHMESTTAHLKQLQAELESTYSSMLNTDTLNTAIDGVTALAETFNDFIEGLGGGGQALTYFGSMAVNVFSKQIGSSIFQTIQNIKSVKTNLEAFKAKEKWADAVLKDVKEQHLAKGEGKLDDSALAKEAQYAQKTLQIRQALTQEQYDQFTAMQAEIGLKERELNYLKEYKNIAFEVLNTEEASFQEFTDQLKEAQGELKEFESMRSKISKDMKAYNENQLDTPADRKALQDEIQSMLNKTRVAESEATAEADKIAYKKQALILEQAIQNVINQRGLEEDQIKAILEAENRVIQNQHGYINKIKQGIEGKKAAENGTLAILEEEQAARERILRQQQEQAEKQLKIQKAVQAVGTALEIGTALVNAMAVGFDKASSGAEKANAAFAGITGVAAGIADYLLPGSGILVQGAFSLVKTGLEAVGVWDNFENIFKSTSEKIAEINEATSKNNVLTQKTNEQVSSLKAVEEEYAELSQKAGQYGEKLDQMTAEEQARYTELTNTFAQYNESIILGYDEQGRAIVNNQTAIQKTIDMLKEQAELEARENLGNISKGLKAKNKEITTAQEEYDTAEYKNNNAELLDRYNFFMSNMSADIYDESGEAIGSYANQTNMVAALQSYKQYIDNLSKECRETEVSIGDTTYTVEKLAEEANQLAIAINVSGGSLSVDQFSQFEQITAALNEYYTNQDNFIDTVNRRGKVKKSAAKNFENFSEDNWAVKAIAEQYQADAEAIDQMQVNFNNANKKLQELQNLDTNYILSIIQYGEGYDQQWDNLSDGAQQVGARLIIDYIENLEYGAVEEAAKKKDQEGKIYETAVEMVQDFVESFGKAFELAGTLLQDAIEKANLDEFKGTAVEYKEKIANIIKEVLGQIDQTELQDQETRNALEAYFKNQFGLSDLDINFDSGEVEDITTAAENAYIDTRRKIHKKLQLMNLKPEGGGLTANWLEGILDEDQLGNIDAILDNFDYAGYVEAGQNIDALGIYLKKAAEAATEAENATAKYNREMQSNKDILEKFANKESLNESEKEYLKTLEQEYPILKRLQRGSEEYSKALEKVQEEQTKKYKKGLEQQLEDLKENLKVKKQALDDFDGDKNSEEYAELQQGVLDTESDIQDTEYEMNVILKAEPSIKDQIKSLYDESDTLLTLRATVENGEALNENQQNALGDFFASDQGQPFIDEYLETGVLTDQMLDAAEAFADAKTELAQEAKEDLVTEAEELKTAADRLQIGADRARESGYETYADGLQSKADAKYAEAGDKVAEIATIDSEENDYQKNKDDAFDSKVDKFDIDGEDTRDLGENLQEAAKDSEVLSENLVDNADAAREVAKEIKRAEKAVESIKDNYKDWSKALEESNEFSEEYGEALEGMRTSFEDFLDLDYDSLSDEFVKSAEAQELLQKAMSGTGEEAQTAYNELQALAAQDIYNENIGNLSEEISNEMQEIAAIESVDVGEKIVVGENEVANKLNNLYSNAVNAAIAGGQSVASAMQTANSIINAVGYEAPEIEMEEKTVTVTGQLPDGWTPQPNGEMTGPDGQLLQGVKWTEESGGTYTYTQTMLVPKAKSFTKSSENLGGANTGGGGNGGGGGGGGGGKGKAAKKVDPRKKNYYHDVNNALSKLVNQYDKLAEQQDKTFGKKHIDNIKKTNENLDKQIDKMRERIKIANEQEKKDLKKDITKNYKDVKFNKDGTIKNYEEVLQKYYNKYANKKQSQESQEKNKEKYDKLKELLDEYETLILETIPGWEAEVREKIDEKYENMVHQFEYEIEMRVNWGDSVREVREFFHEIGDYSEDFKNIALFNLDQAASYFDSNEITSRTRQLSDALGELDKINAANAKGYKITNKDEEKYFSDIWGDNKEGLMDYIATLQTDLMDAILNIQDSRDDAYDAYLDAIDEGIDKMDRHLEQYEIINEQLEHNRNLVELIYGETSDQLANIYVEQRNAQLEQIKGQKNAADMYYERMINAQDRLNKETKGTDRYKEIEEEVEQFTDLYNEAVSNVNATVEESIELIISKYEYAIQQIFKNINNDLLNTSITSITDPLNTLQIGSLEEASLQWDLLNQEAEQYLDATNSTFEVQKLEAKYLDALNRTDNLKAQQKISDVMNEQISMLEKKDELSQYEVDRANLIYDLTLKQIALEEAQQNKSKMRLRRDAQGNYSYQFTADADLIKQTQQELLDVQQQLYNLDKDNYQSQLNEMYGYYVEWQEKLAEVAMIKDVDERNRTAALVNDYYTKLMQNANDQAQIAKTNLDELVEGPLADFYKANEDIAIGPNGLSSMYESALSVLSDKFAGEDGISNQVQTAWEDISKKAEIYKEELDAIASASGEAFDKLSTDEELNKITGGIGDITTATEALGKEWKTVLDSISEFINKLDALLKDEKIEKAKKVIKESEKVETTELKTSGDAAEKANITAVADPVPEPTKTTTTTTNNKNKEDKKDDKNKNKNKTKTIKKGGKINAKGAKIYDAPGGTGKTQYYKNDPKYKVLKISGNWVQARYHKLSSGVSGWFKKSAVKALNTGGYTGDWNSNEGRIALLHKKELVLNQKDTKNILDAVNIIRGLGGLLQNSMVSRIEGLTQSLNGISIPTVQNNPETGPQSVEQTVHITAEFPGATEVIQIEQALENLVSRASQYALRRKE